MKVAIIIGHSSKDQGASNKKFGITEFLYNNKVAPLISEFSNENIELVYRIGTYRQLPKLVNDTKANIAFSLHCNGINKKVSGTETLSSGSKNSLKLANIIQPKMVALFGLNDRGIKIRKRDQRGGIILHDTNMPCVLLEPFFIDNDSDYAVGIKKLKDYARIIAETIEEYKNLSNE